MLFSLLFPPSAPASGALSRLRASPSLAGLLLKGIAGVLAVSVDIVRIVEATDPVYGTYFFPAAAASGGRLRALQAPGTVQDVVVIGLVGVSSLGASASGPYAGASLNVTAMNMRTLLASAFGADAMANAALAPFAAEWGANAPASIALLAFRMPLPPQRASATAAGASSGDEAWYSTPERAVLLALGAASVIAAIVAAAAVARRRRAAKNTVERAMLRPKVVIPSAPPLDSNPLEVLNEAGGDPK